MPIEHPHPVAHPVQNVSLDKLAVDTFAVSNGANVDRVASVSVQLRPYAEVTAAGGGTAYITSDAVPQVGFDIPDLYAWIAERAGLGDMVPMQALGRLLQAVGEEYARRVTPPPEE